MTQTNESQVKDSQANEQITIGKDDSLRTLAVCHRPAKAAASPAAVNPASVSPASVRPGLVWLGGYRSDMMGTKAVELDRFAQRHGLECTRFDYSGHGRSGGDFKQGTISRWLEESLAVVDRFTDGPQLLIGSSMGAWIALRMVQELQKKGLSARVC